MPIKDRIVAALQEHKDKEMTYFEVNGFEPGGKGVLASKVVDSCKSGKLIVKVP